MAIGTSFNAVPLMSVFKVKNSVDEIIWGHFCESETNHTFFIVSKEELLRFMRTTVCELITDLYKFTFNTDFSADDLTAQAAIVGEWSEAIVKIEASQHEYFTMHENE